MITSDRKVLQSISPTIDQIGKVIDKRIFECKIEFSSEKNIAISCANDLDAARNVAKKIIEELTEAARTDQYSAAIAMQTIAERVLDDGNHFSIRCLIALKCPNWHLFTCTSEIGKNGVEFESHCDGWEVAGHVTNPAIFLACYHSEKYSVRELIPLASYLTLCAYNFNSQLIEGLDVVSCDGQGVRRLSGSAIQQLEQQKWDDTIRQLFVDYNRQYSYIPPTPALP